MAILIKIEKYNQDNNTHYYHVDPGYGEEKTFCFGIDSKTGKMTLYKDTSSKEIIATLDLFNPNQLIKAPGISPRTLVNVFLQVNRALKNNEFPKYLDYCA